MVDFFSRIWVFILSVLGEDFVFLALLGFLMACTIHLINRGVAICNSARMWLWGQIAINQHYASQYFAWISLPVILILFSTAFTDVVSPAAKGSGKPLSRKEITIEFLSAWATYRQALSYLLDVVVN